MTEDENLLWLESKDTAQAYRALLELERQSEKSDALYPYTERFARMCTDERYAVRVRGFRSFAFPIL